MECGSMGADPKMIKSEYIKGQSNQSCRKDIKQRMIHVSANYYDDLIIEIEKWIRTFEDVYEIQQIDYFNMDVNSNNSCDAFILFRPKIIKE